MKPCAAFALLAGLLAPPAAVAQYTYGQNPDWPCAQRLVETLAPGSYWNGPVPLHTAWRDDETLFPLVTLVVNRDTPEADSIAKLQAYAATQAKAARPAIFSALVDETNDERSLLVRRLEKLGRRQRAMGDRIATLSHTIDTSPNRDELIGERDLDVRAFSETQRILRYACEAPANMERRLGLMARLLQKP